MSSIIIDEEFANLLPSLASTEHEELERSLIEHGRALDPLKVWKEKGILLDGHNRLPICEKYDLKYDVVYLSFRDRQAAIEWITRYQLSRRNLTPGQRNEFFEKVYKAHKKEEGGDGTNQHSEELGKIYPVPKDEETPKKTRTSEKIAKQAGVSEKTIRNAVKQSEVVNKVGETAPKLRKAIIDSPKRVPAKVVEELADNPDLSVKVEEKVIQGVEVVEAVKEVKAELQPDEEQESPPASNMPDHIRAVFNLKPRVRKVISAVRDAKKALETLANDHPEVCAFLHYDHAAQQLHEVKAHINLSQPFNLCPYCRAKPSKQDTCKGCKGNGWVPKSIFVNAPRELREVIK